MKELEEDLSEPNVSRISSFSNSEYFTDINEINSISNINNLLDDIKPSLIKIRCPYCPFNCVCKINPYNYTISSDCSNNHNYNSDIIEFFNKSLLQQDEKIKCSNDYCKSNEKDKLELYYCNCGQILCKKCIESHKNIYDDKKSHNSINFNEKDEKCCCSDNFANYSCYCQKCQKNLCTNCYNSHTKKGHIIYFYGDEEINRKEKKNIDKELQKQKIDLNKFIEKINQIIKELIEKINELKRRLLYFVKINEIIFKSYDDKQLNHEIITNMKNIKKNFNSKIYYFINSQNFEESILFLLNLIGYQKIKKQEILFNKNDASIQYNKNKDFNFALHKAINYLNLEEKINVMCEIKSKNLLAFGGESGKIYLYNNIDFKKAEFDITNDNQSIKYLCELKDGFLVVCTSDYFKIYEIILKNNSKKFNVIQKIEYQEKNHNESKSKVVELTNGNLLSVDGNLLKIWRKKLNSNIYENEHEIKINDLIFDLFEVNINKFFIYTINDNFQIFDSVSYEKKLDQLSNKNKNNNNWKIVSVQKLNDDTIIIIEKNTILLYSLITNKIQECTSPKNIDGLYMLCKNQFYIYNTITENAKYGVIKYEYSVLKNVHKSINTYAQYYYILQIGFIYKISVNDEYGNCKNLLLIKFNNHNKNSNRKEKILIFKEVS